MTRIRILKSAVENATAVAEAPPAWMKSNIVVIPTMLFCVLCGVVALVAVCAHLWQSLGVENSGLKKKVLQSLPRFAYVDSDPTTWAAMTECAICLADFAAGDEIRVLPQCGHGFHVGCIDTWLGSHSSCPSCRQVLAVDSDYSGSEDTGVTVMQCLVLLITFTIIIPLFIFVVVVSGVV